MDINIYIIKTVINVLLMKPLEGATVKSLETGIIYPIHRIINHQYIYSTTFYNSVLSIYKNDNSVFSFYRGAKYQIPNVFINRYIDIYLFEKYGSSIETSVYSSISRIISYPLSTFEINNQLNNKLKWNYSVYYRGYPYYFVNNTLNYYLFWNLMKYYDSNIRISTKNKNVNNAYVGFLTGLSVEFIMNPLKVLKTNYQNHNNKIFNVGKILTNGLIPRMLLSGIQVAIFNTIIPVTKKGSNEVTKKGSNEVTK